MDLQLKGKLALVSGSTAGIGYAIAHTLAQEGAADALKLRQWDDLAKTAGATTPPLQHFLQRAARCALA